MRRIDRAPTALAAAGALALAGCVANSPRTSVSPTAPAGAYAIVDSRLVPVPPIQMGDAKTIDRIIRVGMNDNRTLEHMTELCETFGARLTGSTSCERSANWARTTLSSWGLNRARLDWWGDIATRFDRGPSRAVAIIPTPDDPGRVVRELQFTTLSWTRGTDGPVRAPVAPMPASPAEVSERISGAWVLIPPDYTDQGNIRRSGQLMRQRTDERHAIRAGANPAPVATAAPDPAPSGAMRWTGSFMYGDSRLPLTLDLTRTPDGAFEGTQSIKEFHAGPITDAQYDEATKTLTYTWRHSMGRSNIELRRDVDTMTGASVSMTGERYPIELSLQPAGGSTPAPVGAAPGDTVLERVLAMNPAGFISSSLDERVWTTSVNGWRERPASEYPLDVEVNIRQSDYDFINSRVADGAEVLLEIDLPHAVSDGPFPCYNVVAEITGVERPDEVVICSAHLDSWDGPGSQGAIDNATGVSVVMEAARILAEAGARPKRTIRFILWTGEEQGLLGSRAYVASLSQEELDKISAVFVDDGGTNYEGGLPAADYMVDYLAAATAPVNGRFFSETDYHTEMTDDDPSNDFHAGFMDVNIRPTGTRIETHSGSDHAPFNAVGVPGFFWDETGRANYRYAWHTQRDRLDQAIGEYLAQSSTNMAVVAYNLAMAPDLLPRVAPDGSGLATVETAAPTHE